MQFKLLWIKASAKSINVYVNLNIPYIAIVGKNSNEQSMLGNQRTYRTWKRIFVG